MENELQEAQRLGGEIQEMVNQHFDDWDKTKRWFGAVNPLLGNVTPRSMLGCGRGEKLKKFVTAMLAGEMP